MDASVCLVVLVGAGGDGAFSLNKSKAQFVIDCTFFDVLQAAILMKRRTSQLKPGKAEVHKEIGSLFQVEYPGGTWSDARAYTLNVRANVSFPDGRSFTVFVGCHLHGDDVNSPMLRTMELLKCGRKQHIILSP